METDDQITHYIFEFYRRFMTRTEGLACNHLATTLKATMGRSDLRAQHEVRESKIHSRWLSDDPEVLHLADEGYAAFVRRTAARILHDHRDEIFFNRCLKCSGLARTPTAMQCRFCGHDWHS